MFHIGFILISETLAATLPGIMMEQKLANHLRYKEYEQALEIALELEKPRQALKVSSPFHPVHNRLAPRHRPDLEQILC
jgi:hypothetical protein